MSGVGNVLSNINHTMMGWVGADAKKPKNPTPAPAAPTMSNQSAALDKASDEELQRRLLGGRSSTMLTGGAGLSNTGQVSSSALLGS